MKRKDWESLLATVPPGLTGAEVARHLKQHPQVTNYWIKRLKYPSVDGRLKPSPEKFSSIRRVQLADIDWSETNNQVLAKRHGVSRERIRQLRKLKLEMPADDWKKALSPTKWPHGLGDNR